MLWLIPAQQHKSIGDTSPAHFGSSSKRFQRVREQLVVLVEDKKPVTMTCSHPRIAIRRKAAILWPAHVVETVSEAPSRLASRVGAAIVRNDDLIGSARLAENTFDGLRNCCRAIVSWNDDADRHECRGVSASRRSIVRT